jgi:ABC-type ATPase with predicted acetyltransferase domain
VTWESQGSTDGSQVFYEYQLLGSTETDFEAIILQQMNTTATVTVASISLSYNYTNIIFSITAHNCAGNSNETIHIIQVQGEINNSTIMAYYYSNACRFYISCICVQ